MNCNSIEKHRPAFFFGRFVFRLLEITYAKNCIFACIHKEIDNALFPGANYSFNEIGLQITSHLLSSSFGSSSLTLASEITAYFLQSF